MIKCCREIKDILCRTLCANLLAPLEFILNLARCGHQSESDNFSITSQPLGKIQSVSALNCVVPVMQAVRPIQYCINYAQCVLKSQKMKISLNAGPIPGI
jgi:hypothetical protein